MDKNGFYIGVDEVARGTLIGRLYASAVILNPSIPVHPFIRDSKKLTPEKRAIAREFIEKTAIDYVVDFIEPDEIDKINIRQANIKAFNNVIRKMTIKANHVYIDGNDFIPDANCPYPKNQIETVIKGDSKYAAISAASILAKEYHDDHIRELCLLFPDLDTKYDLLSNMGYGTKNHIQGIRDYGFSPFHRLTFKIGSL
jgi:ribonuclease HII